MIYLLDKTITGLPEVPGMVRQEMERTAAKDGTQLPPINPLEDAADRMEIAEIVQASLKAREEIARIEEGQ